jgi:hypothetical protein
VLFVCECDIGGCDNLREVDSVVQHEAAPFPAIFFVDSTRKRRPEIFQVAIILDKSLCPSIFHSLDRKGRM